MSTHKPSFRTDLERRAWRAMLAYAIFRWESAVVIALTIVLTALYTQPFPWWPGWGWPAIGLIAEVLIIVTSITDVRTGEQVVADMFRQEYNPGAIRDRDLRSQLERALEYRARIETLVRSQSAGVLRDRLESTTLGVQDWIANIFRLAQRLDAFEADDVIHQDIRDTPAAVRNLEIRQRNEDDPAVQDQLQQALQGKRTQLQTLQTLQNTIEKAEAQLEATVTALGTVYAQLQLISAKKAEGSTPERIADSIRDEVAALNDLVAAMDEVYDGR
jgi:head-tail adaptor